MIRRITVERSGEQVVGYIDLARQTQFPARVVTIATDLGALSEELHRQIEIITLEQGLLPRRLNLDL